MPWLRPVPASSGVAGAGAIVFRLSPAGQPVKGSACQQKDVCLQLVSGVRLSCVAVCCVPGVAVCRMLLPLSSPGDCSLVGVCSMAGVGVPCCGASSALNEC